ASRTSHAARRKDSQFGLAMDGAGDQSSRDHRAESFHGEYTVDGQTRQGVRVTRFTLGGGGDNGALQIVEARAGERADGDDGGTFKKRSAQKFFDFEADNIEGFGIDRVGFGQNRDAALHA